jgi:hypothetical protein
MTTATIAAHDLTLQHQLIDLVRCARKTADEFTTTDPTPPIPLRDWLTYLADDLEHRADTLNLPVDNTTLTPDVGELADQHPLAAIKQALEQLSNTARRELISLAPESPEAHRLDDLVQSLDMHWWVCHRAAA